MLSEDILYLPVSELAARIRARRLSPVELTESYLDRSRRIGARLNAYAALTPELALRQARAAEQEIGAGRYRGPLHGIPYAAKDLLAVTGYPTSWGARPFARQQFDFDATVIRKLNQAGAVLIGKAAMIELAGGLGYRYASASLTGAAKNPWNEGCWTCGSSSGSGALVAAARAAFAIGTETWGSIVCPSAFCGVSGLRPTFGRVSRYGAMALAYSMDKIGPICRSADDCGLVLEAIAGHDARDLGSLPASEAAFRHAGEGAGQPSAGSGRRLRLGWVQQWKDKPGAQAAERAARAAVDSLTFAQVEDAQLPEGPWEQAAGVTVSAEAASAFERLIESGGVSELADPLSQVGGYAGGQIPASDLLHAARARSILQQKVKELFGRFDVLVAASEPVGATPLDTNLETGLDYPDPLGGIGNLCGLPALSVPCGFDDRRLPLGLLFVGDVLAERTLIDAARRFQMRTDWHRQRPPIT